VSSTAQYLYVASIYFNHEVVVVFSDVNPEVYGAVSCPYLVEKDEPSFTDLVLFLERVIGDGRYVSLRTLTVCS